MPSTSRASSLDQFLGVTEPWQITVLRSRNLGILRPEKSWRPIVTMEVDGQHKHEIVLGVDGQNPNQREIMLLHHAHHQTQLKFNVLHKSQSKAKSRKRRRFVASAMMPLGEVMKKQGTDPYVEFSLSGIPDARRKSAAQKYQPCAALLIRLRPPPSAMPDEDEDENEDGVSLISSADKCSSDILLTPATEEPENTPPWASGVPEKSPTGLRRRKIVKGYCINSEEEHSDGSGCCLSESETEETKDLWEPSIPSDDCPITPHLDTLEIREYTLVPSTVSVVFPSLLPLTYVADNVSITSGTSLASSAFDTLTYHRELREAQMDSDVDRVLGRLLSEWYYTGASLLSITAVDTTVFGFSSSSNLFGVDSFAKRSLIISTVAAAIGLFIDVWFIFVYSGADVRKFNALAVDIYGSYFFFALSSRLPLIALIISVLALVGFLGAVAWVAWPTAVLVMCGIAGVLVSLQFIVYGFHRLALCLAWFLRAAWLGAVYIGSRIWALFPRGQAQDPVENGSVTAHPASMRAVPASRHTT